jgi:hypothetical protein
MITVVQMSYPEKLLLRHLMQKLIGLKKPSVLSAKHTKSQVAEWGCGVFAGLPGREAREMDHETIDLHQERAARNDVVTDLESKLEYLRTEIQDIRDRVSEKNDRRTRSIRIRNVRAELRKSQ